MQFKELDEEIEKISHQIAKDNDLLAFQIRHWMHYIGARFIKEYSKIMRDEEYKPDAGRKKV